MHLFFSRFTEMGCRESKHAVATGNTISRKKSDAGSRKSKYIKTVGETSDKGKKTDSLVQQEESQNVSKCLVDEDALAVGDEVKKDITDEHRELKEGAEQMNKGDGVAVEEQEAPAAGRLISKESPNRFFSSRKDEDVEGFAAEGRSEFFSPRLGSEKENSFSDCVKSDDVVEETLDPQKMVCTLGTTPSFY